MTIRQQTFAALIALPVAVCAVEVAVIWQTNVDFHGGVTQIPLFAFAFHQLLVRLVIAVVLVVMSCLVLIRPPATLVSAVYVTVGILFSLAAPVLLWSDTIVGGRIPELVWMAASDGEVQHVVQYLFVLGAAGFIRSHFATRPRPNHAMERTADRAASTF
jgi:hypothetical protein